MTVPRSSARLPAPRKRFGQHFLKDSKTLDAIVEALGPIGDRTVIEIGPGRGVLTDRLVERAARVIAIEVDRDLVAMLRDRYRDRPSVEIVEADVLTVDLAALAGGPYVLVGNVPYYITTPILFHALAVPRPERAVYLVQLEVAERMAAAPGGKEYGALSVNVQAVATVELVRRVPPSAFNPPPAVDSAVVRIMPRTAPVIEPSLERRFRTLVQGAFGLRRKQLVRVLRTLTALDAEAVTALVEACALAPTARPEVLSPEDFARLVHALHDRGLSDLTAERTNASADDAAANAADDAATPDLGA
jgi:16S rRNA (adenine1518-N6/adenine1519-N6)-dimethyltransferase